MHSPWGVIYQIVKETGWSWHYILWKVSRANIMLMIADRSVFKTKPDGEEKVVEDTGQGLAKRLKARKAR